MPSWKTSPLNNLTDARYFNALNQAVLTFSFDALHPQAVNIATSKGILEWLYDADLVASFGSHQDTAEINYVLEETGISCVELPFGHVLCHDVDLAPHLYIRLSAEQASEALESSVVPKAWVVELTSTQEPNNNLINTLVLLSEKSALYICVPPQSDRVISWVQNLPTTGIELEIIPEERPGWSSVDVYAEIIELLED
jgi:hypothetical protein